jgi:hypothetical protein
LTESVSAKSAPTLTLAGPSMVAAIAASVVVMSSEAASRAAPPTVAETLIVYSFPAAAYV